MAIINTIKAIGDDGMGANQELEDGRAMRNPNITQGNQTFTFEEYTIFNDTGEY